MFRENSRIIDRSSENGHCVGTYIVPSKQKTALLKCTVMAHYFDAITVKFNKSITSFTRDTDDTDRYGYIQAWPSVKTVDSNKAGCNLSVFAR